MADEFTAARSTPGQAPGGTDDRELFLVKFGGLVLEAYTETNSYDAMNFQQTIVNGKSHSFPIIGRKRDATEHDPGAQVLGGSIESNEVVIEVDKLIYDAAFVDDLDAIMAHYDLYGPYARQLGESLAVTYDKRSAIMHIIASRETVEPYTGGPLPSYAFHADMKTDPTQLETAFFAAVQHIRENDIGGGEPAGMLPWAQHLLLARWSGFQAGIPASGAAPFDQSGRRTGIPMPMAGITVKGTNHIPNTNITTGNVKFRGDFTTTVGHVGNRMAVGSLNVRSLRVVVKDQPERFGTLLLASKANGLGKLRPECSFEIATATR